MPLIHLVAFDQHDPNANVTTGMARKLGLRERDGQFEFHNRKPSKLRKSAQREV